MYGGQIKEYEYQIKMIFDDRRGVPIWKDER